MGTVTAHMSMSLDGFIAGPNGGEQGPCGWLKDKYGVSWQIVPTILDELIRDPDTAKSQRAMEAMLGMKRIDVAELQRAAG